MNHLVFFIATLQEAHDLILRVSAKTSGPNSFSFAGGDIIITGMGPLAACRAARGASSKTFWVNIGIAGTFDEGLSLGRCVTVGYAFGLGWDAERHFFIKERGLLLHEQYKATLYTAHRPVHEKIFKTSAFSCIDMEGYAIARVAAARKVPVLVTKVLSDYCSSTSSHVISRDLPILSKQVAREALNIIDGKGVFRVPVASMLASRTLFEES